MSGHLEKGCKDEKNMDNFGVSTWLSNVVFPYKNDIDLVLGTFNSETN